IAEHSTHSSARSKRMCRRRRSSSTCASRASSCSRRFMVAAPWSGGATMRPRASASPTGATPIECGGEQPVCTRTLSGCLAGSARRDPRTLGSRGRRLPHRTGSARAACSLRSSDLPHALQHDLQPLGEAVFAPELPAKVEVWSLFRWRPPPPHPKTEEHKSELQSQSKLLFPLFFFNDPAPTEIYPLSLHDALPISRRSSRQSCPRRLRSGRSSAGARNSPITSSSSCSASLANAARIATSVIAQHPAHHATA